MEEPSVENTAFADPIHLVSNGKDNSGLEACLTLGTFADIRGEHGTSSLIFLASDGNTTFALDLQQYAHLTYPGYCTEGPIEDPNVSDMVVRCLSFDDDPLTLEISQDHKWKSIMERWRSTVETMNSLSTTFAEESSEPIEAVGRRWVPSALPDGLSLRELQPRTSEILTKLASQYVPRLTTLTGPSEERERAADQCFQVVQNIKPMWD